MLQTSANFSVCQLIHTGHSKIEGSKIPVTAHFFVLETWVCLPVARVIVYTTYIHTYIPMCVCVCYIFFQNIFFWRKLKNLMEYLRICHFVEMESSKLINYLFDNRFVKVTNVLWYPYLSGFITCIQPAFYDTKKSCSCLNPYIHSFVGPIP